MPSEPDSPRGMPDRVEGKSSGQYPALTVQQPWAELIIAGRKSIEVRSWWTDYRGPLWIHAGRKEDVDEGRKFGLLSPFRGGFIGRVVLTTIVQFDSDRWSRWRERHLSDGPMPQLVYGWVLKDPVRLTEPFPARGKLGLFRPEGDITDVLQTLLP